MSDTVHSIFQSAKRFFSGTILSRVTGLLRDIAMASAFGTNEAVAAFLVAFRFAHLLRRLFGEGALQTAFIPQFETLRKKDPQRACRFFCDLVAGLSAGLIGIVFITMLVLGSLLYYVEFSPGNREILFLTLLLMPSLLFICLFGINASLLQCEKSYFISGVAPVAFNIFWVIGVLTLWNTPIAEAMPWLSVWVIIACFAQWFMTVPSIISILKSNGLRNPWGNVKLFSTDMRLLFKPLMLGILGVAASQVNNALDAVFARYADLEGPAFLWYAIRIQQLPLALFGIAISGALLPPLTRAIKNQDWAAYQRFIEFTLRRSMALMMPITIALFVMGDSSINLLYGRGDFTDVSTTGTTLCLWGYGIGLIPMGLILILAPAFYAQSKPHVPAFASVGSMVLNATLNAILIMGLGMGAVSVAIATSVSAWVNLAILMFALEHRHYVISSSILINIGKGILASCAAGVAVILLDSLSLHTYSAWQILQGEIPALPHGFSAQALRFGAQFVVFTGTLLATARLLNAKDLQLSSWRNSALARGDSAVSSS